jgi:prephenate dehydrogenase
VNQPPFRRVAIYGLGLIGGSIALAVKRRWPAVVVTAIDRPAVVDTALRMRIADGGGDTLASAADADLVMLAAPVLQNAAALALLPGHLRQPAVVTDAGSTKRVMLEAAAALPPHLEFIGGHPLSGAAVSGVDAARPDLFDDRPWILTPAPNASAASLDALTQLVSGLRAIPHQMPADEHDRLLAYISHLPQLAVSALMSVVGGQAREDGLALAGRGLRDTTRLASSPAATWRDIVATNGDNVATALDDLIAALQRLKAAHERVPGDLDEIFTSANRWKGVLEHG